MAQRDSVERITEAAERIRRMHAIDGLSWRQIAATGEFGDVSHTTLRDVANGHEPSAATCRAMGVRKTDRYRLHYECGRGAAGRERDRELRDEMAVAGVGSFTEYVDWLREQVGE